MQNINFSSKKMQKLIPYNLDYRITNSEGDIYQINFHDKPYIFKRLYSTEGLVFANKLYTLEMLDLYHDLLPDNFYIPEKLVSVKNNIEGFLVPKCEGINLSILLKNNIPLSEKIFYLKEIGNTLEKLSFLRKNSHLNDFYLNDLQESNIIVNENSKTLNFIDLDSSKIGLNLPFLARYLTPMALLNNSTKYQITKEGIMGYVMPDNNTDIYCYIIIILNFLYGANVNNMPLQEYYDYLNYLEKLGFEKEFITICAKIVENVPNENPKDYLDSFTLKKVNKAQNFLK